VHVHDRSRPTFASASSAGSHGAPRVSGVPEE
jgi:hypothetical protein